MAEVYPTSSSGESYSFSGGEWSDEDAQDRRDAYHDYLKEKQAEYDVNVAELEDLMSRGDEDGALAFLDAHPQLARRADLHAAHGYGVEFRPRLWAAATYGCLRVMEYLVQRGASVTSISDWNQGASPLMWAVAAQHLPAAHWLLKRGANVIASS
jgi:hypothetical protein